MDNRDDFPKKMKEALALRANHQCSFTGCGRRTSGPSDESTAAVTNIGIVAHITAAAPGGKRYDATMFADDRSGIDNAIWLCASHAALIDRDEATYTVAVLKNMKRVHEERCAEDVRTLAQLSSSNATLLADLFAIGPDVVCLGEMIEIDADEWKFEVKDFVIGDYRQLVTFIDRFDGHKTADQYVLAGCIGDGRVLAKPPSIVRRGSEYVVRCAVTKSFPRIRAVDLPRDFALSSKTNDLTLENGDIVTVSGVAALPQKLWMCLSHQRGESPFHRDFGSRLAEYYGLLQGSPWFERLFKLEVIRQAAIPYHDPTFNRDYTPLQCVEHVLGVKMLAAAPENNLLPVRIDLDVNGIGRWSHEIRVFIPGDK